MLQYGQEGSKCVFGIGHARIFMVYTKEQLLNDVHLEEQLARHESHYEKCRKVVRAFGDQKHV